ncbi:MAG: hypothetical protein HY958_02335 [Bacteroidia bacterium]|nr:hypothetical protein [Bacteroidia bacterium]
MQKHYKIALAGVIIMIVIMIVGKILVRNVKNSTDKNPYELNLDTLGKIPEKYQCYKEVNKIKIDFSCPHGIAFDTGDNIWVSGDSLLLKLNNSGKEISRVYTRSIGFCIAIDKDNKIFIGAENHIEIYSPSGNLLNKWQNIGDSSVITSIALKPDMAYIADAHNNFIYQFGMDGIILNKIGTKDTSDEITRFIIPSYYFDVAVDAEGFLWAANTGMHIMVKFDETGKPQSHWGKASASLDGFCGCCNPSHFAILRDGSFITAEKGIVRVKKYNKNGEFLCALAGSDKFAKNSKGLDIAVDSKQKIYILEPQAKLIHVFQN